MPFGHGSYRGLEVELLDPGDEDELVLLLEAQHAELADALDRGDEVIVDGEAFSPRPHLTMHQIVASQLLADDPPETWQTVQRLAGMGYDWHNIMHMIARVISDDVYQVLKEGQQIDPAEHARRLAQLPGAWPARRGLERSIWSRNACSSARIRTAPNGGYRASRASHSYA
jgi:hypothetical protein